jgi:S-formylglutathione hydrolase FrmB
MLIICFALSCICCKQKNSEINAVDSLEMNKENFLTNDTILSIESFEVEIRIPKSEVRGDLLVLPGWGFSRTRWCEETELCEKALSMGLRVILPEMGKSVYQGSNYPETRKDWSTYPTRTWVNKRMLPELQSLGILTENKNNFIMGLSTGARGVILICLDHPGLFSAASALSGDLDQTLMKEDNLMKGVYGNYSGFKDRWEGDDNPTKRIADWNTPVYLGHGKHDKVVPCEQTKLFYEKLMKCHPKSEAILNMPEEGHDFTYWGAEVQPSLDFFQTHMR